MQEHYIAKVNYLTIDNRRLIDRWKIENDSYREFACLLVNSPQMIHDGVKIVANLQQVRKGLYKKV